MGIKDDEFITASRDGLAALVLQHINEGISIDYHTEKEDDHGNLTFTGDTALIVAARHNQLEIVKLLISYKECDINARNDDGDTALHASCDYDNRDVTDYLISNGCDQTIQNKYGFTANSFTTVPPVKKLCCDKCNGKHLSKDCPYYKNEREDHPDSSKQMKKLGSAKSSLPFEVIVNPKIVRQKADGSCLFHSLAHGLGGRANAKMLRAEVCNFISSNPNYVIADAKLKDWINWDSSCSVSEYARNMSSSANWGGGIEMAVVSIIKDCNIHVYEKVNATYKRISAFDRESNPQSKCTIRVLYCGGVHYDFIQ